MRTWNWMTTAALLVAMSAAAQQAGGPQSSAQPAANDATQTAQPQASAPAPQPTQAPPPPVATPTTMDQVVNLFIEREHGLIKMLANRTPVVETYLQNLTADPQLGPVPSDDRYFLGRRTSNRSRWTCRLGPESRWARRPSTLMRAIQ